MNLNEREQDFYLDVLRIYKISEKQAANLIRIARWNNEPLLATVESQYPIFGKALMARS